jgi:hypothetical protein
MMRLNPRHIENCTREINRWAKATRLIHALELNLPQNKVFPEPDLIEPGRKPFDLRVTWEADNPGHSANLRKRIAAMLGLEMKWQPEGGGYLGLRGRLRLGEKTTLNLRLLVADGT